MVEPPLEIVLDSMKVVMTTMMTVVAVVDDVVPTVALLLSVAQLPELDEQLQPLVELRPQYEQRHHEIQHAEMHTIKGPQGRTRVKRHTIIHWNRHPTQGEQRRTSEGGG